MKILVDEDLAISKAPECFCAGFKEAFNRFRRNDDPPRKDPCSWFTPWDLAAWRVGFKYGKYIQELESKCVVS